ncbi:hypothetical protein NDU88_005789 [Pleurodeles waltl]|uniref:Uncharacterized protein n=1 Tax=Pleurodeles waltl TaxID=8319 RepID=A0AAV7W8T9_PLEWA|nr:hypothetical protein NDU88_005789 [Pleurodeles waltl]
MPKSVKMSEQPYEWSIRLKLIKLKGKRWHALSIRRDTSHIVEKVSSVKPLYALRLTMLRVKKQLAKLTRWKPLERSY